MSADSSLHRMILTLTLIVSVFQNLSRFIAVDAWSTNPTSISYKTNHHHHLNRWSSTPRSTILHPVSTQSIVPSFTAPSTSTTTTLFITPVPMTGLTTTQPLLTYFLETLISQGIPAVFWIIVIAFAAKSFSRKGGSNTRDDSLFGGNVVDELYDDLYSSDSSSSSSGGGSMLSNLFQSIRRSKNTSPIKNLGIPSETYLTLTPLNPMYQSYEYSFTAATQSKAKAAALLRTKNFDQALKRAVDSSLVPLTSSEAVDLLTEEKAFLKQGKEIMDTVRAIQYKITKRVIEQEMEAMEVEVGEVDPQPYEKQEEEEKDANTKNQTETSSSHKLHEHRVSEMSWWKTTWNRFFPGKDAMVVEKLITELEEENSELLRLELEFIRSVVEIMGPERANGIRAAILGNIQGGNAAAGTLFKSLQERPLSSILKTLGYMGADDPKNARKRLFVTDFIGDVTASQVDDLREEVTGILRSAQPGDEVLLILQTGGGTVTGYGLGAAQLERFKKSGIKLTVCVEQVAASGGYLMSCVADKIIASPFAVLGSIGVVSDMPNVYNRLQREGIEFQTVTAGKYKRTLTPTKKVTQEDFDKEQQELEEVLTLFKNFVKKNRPSLDIDAVATGETWFGEDALSTGLCDELRTVDDVLIEYIDCGYDVYQVRYDPPQDENGLNRLLPVGASRSSRSRRLSSSNTNNRKSGFLATMVRGFISMVKEEIMIELDGSIALDRNDDLKRRYMVHDSHVSQNVRSEI